MRRGMLRGAPHGMPRVQGPGAMIAMGPGATRTREAVPHGTGGLGKAP